MKRRLLVASERGAAFSCFSCPGMRAGGTTHPQPRLLPTTLLPQCNYKPRHKSWLTFALSHMFVQRLQKYCTRHVIARETKITFIKLSQSGRGGGIFGKSILFAVREPIWENNAEQVFFYQHLKVSVRISKGTDTHPHDSHTAGLCALTLTSCLLFSKPKQVAFPSAQLFPATLTLKLLLIPFLSSPSITAAKQ